MEEKVVYNGFVKVKEVPVKIKDKDTVYNEICVLDAVAAVLYDETGRIISLTNNLFNYAYFFNDKGEIMSGTKSISADLYEETALKGGAMSIPTTNIKLWIDPNNGKFLGKYDEYEFAGDGILYGKADEGKTKVPLYKLSLSNFHNPEGLYEYKSGYYVETEASGPAVVGKGEVRGGLLELSNADLKANIAYYQQGKMQMELSNKLISSYKQLLEEALRLVGD